jgi:hypothetical protein
MSDLNFCLLERDEEDDDNVFDGDEQDKNIGII